MKNLVKELRAARGLSQGERAMALGVSHRRSTRSRGRYVPSLPLASTLARYFESSVEGGVLTMFFFEVAPRSDTFSLGAGCLAAFWVGGDQRSGWEFKESRSSAGSGVATLVLGRSEFVRGFRGDSQDEYWAALRRDAL